MDDVSRGESASQGIQKVESCGTHFEIESVKLVGKVMPHGARANGDRQAEHHRNEAL